MTDEKMARVADLMMHALSRRADYELASATDGGRDPATGIPGKVREPEPKPPEPVEDRADLYPIDVARILGVSEKTVFRRIRDGWFTGEAAPTVAGGLDSVRRRWRRSQVPAILAAFTRPERPRVPLAPPPRLATPAPPAPHPKPSKRPKAPRKKSTTNDRPPMRLIDRVKSGD